MSNQNIALIILAVVVAILWITVPPVGFALLALSFFVLGGIAWKRNII